MMPVRALALVTSVLMGCSSSISTSGRTDTESNCSNEADADVSCAPDAKTAAERTAKDEAKGGATSSASAKLDNDDCVDPDLRKVASDQSIMLCDGTIAKGSLGMCATDGQGACVVDGTAFKAAKLANFTDGDVRAGVTLAGVAGAMSNAPAACSADGQTGCLAVADFPAIDKVASLTPAAASIRASVTLAGVAGTLADCSANGGVSCYVSGAYKAAVPCAANGSNCYVPSYAASTQPLKAVDFDTITPAVIKKNAVIAGVTGNYPSGAYPLTGADGTSDLTDGTFESKVKNGAANFEWFDSEGARYVRAGDSDIADANIKLGVNIFGEDGEVSGITVANQWDLRAGVTIGDVSGRLKTSCRNGGSALTWGIGTPKNAVVTSGDDSLTVVSHGYQTGDVVQVDYVTVPSGISRGVNYHVIKIDNDSFTLASSVANALVPTAINITADGTGVVVSSIGSTPLAATVANGADTLTVTSHGFSTGQAVQISYSSIPTGVNSSTIYYAIAVNANTIKLATTPTYANAGTAINITGDGADVYVFKLGSGTVAATDTIDDYNYAQAVLTSHPWSSSNNFCGGVEASDGDANVWKDVTTDGAAAPSSCAATPANCAMKDKISGLTWTKTQSAGMTWGKARTVCHLLDFNNQSTGWRLPTQKELMDAYSHGIRSAAASGWITDAEMVANYFWSSTTQSNNPTLAWAVILTNGTTYQYTKTNVSQVTCVR